MNKLDHESNLARLFDLVTSVDKTRAYTADVAELASPTVQNRLQAADSHLLKAADLIQEARRISAAEYGEFIREQAEQR